MLHNEHSSDTLPTFDSTEEQWFTTPARRPSQRPTLPAPAIPEPASRGSHLDDAIADGWFYDV